MDGLLPLDWALRNPHPAGARAAGALLLAVYPDAALPVRAAAGFRCWVPSRPGESGRDSESPESRPRDFGAAQSTLESGNSTLHGRRLFSSCFSQLRRGSSNRGVRGRMPALGDARDCLQGGSRRLCPPYSTGFSEYLATRQYVWRPAPRAPRRLGRPRQLQTCGGCHSKASHHLKAAVA